MCSTLSGAVEGTSSRCADMDAMASLAQLVPGRKNNLHTN